MDIKDIRPHLKPAAPVSPAPAARGEGHRATRRDRDGSPDDRVEISDEGRSRAEEADEAAETGVPKATLAPDRLLDIRRRIQARQHDDPEVIASVARRIVERGDI